MAKLTRTQKYADLRNELANDKETTNASQDLSGYVDRFNNVQDTIAPEAPRMPATEPEYTYKPESSSNSSYFDSFMNAPKQESHDDFSSFFNTSNPTDLGIDDIYKEVFNDVNDTTDNTISRNERDTYLNQTINDVTFHNIANGEQTLNQIVDNAVNEVRHTEAPKPVYNEPEVEDNTYAFAPSFNQPLDADAITNDDDFSNTVSMEITKIMNQMNEPIGQANKVVQETPVIQPEVKVEPVVQPQVNVAPIAQPEINVEPIAQPEIKTEPIVQPQVDVAQFVQPEIKVEPVAQPQVNVAPFVQPAINVTPVQTPIANTVIEEKEEIVEIKNIKEMNDEPMRNTVSGTIPFVVSENEDADIDDDADTDGSNVVLNVILIVLIIVLMAVLGLIIFYILKTKGIL